MARILYNGEWYESISSSALYESEYEAVILRHAPELFPNHHAANFRLSVESEFGSSKSDFALIHKDYREWWIVEVEMAHHSLTSHVVPQVRRLASAFYGEREAQYLCKQNPDLDLSRTLELMKGEQPRVYVIVNAPTPSWRERLQHYDALIAVFEIFRSPRNDHLFRLNGDPLPSREDVVAPCTFDPLLKRFLTVSSPSILPVKRGESMEIYYNNSVTHWTRIEAGNKVWLTPRTANPLNPNKPYLLSRNEDGTFTITEGSID